jgi:CubicO group peptidase (beta-lactamase class C family)
VLLTLATRDHRFRVLFFGAVNWGGVYGHSWLVDRTNELTIVSLTNTALEGCTGAYPSALIRAVYDDLI